jgi:hypothetical protein
MKVLLNKAHLSETIVSKSHFDAVYNLSHLISPVVCFETLDNASIQRLKRASAIGRQEFKSYIAKIYGFMARSVVQQATEHCASSFPLLY